LSVSMVVPLGSSPVDDVDGVDVMDGSAAGVCRKYPAARNDVIFSTASVPRRLGKRATRQLRAARSTVPSGTTTPSP
jgi:hypothetical protein